MTRLDFSQRAFCTKKGPASRGWDTEPLNAAVRESAGGSNQTEGLLAQGIPSELGQTCQNACTDTVTKFTIPDYFMLMHDARAIDVRSSFFLPSSQRSFSFAKARRRDTGLRPAHTRKVWAPTSFGVTKIYDEFQNEFSATIDAQIRTTICESDDRRMLFR